MMVSLPQALAKAIDDYRFGRRLKTESEAVRQLIEAGLKAGGAIEAPQPKPSDDGTGGGEKRQRATAPKAPKARPGRSAQPAASKPLSKEAQLRALREQGSRL